ncbi:MAG: hypothetical protein K8F92_11635 [Hyphomicrobium sp.]|uniref:hypothetical protein n=1 Tax=Hyphomicrobium sp. TaxID=82 RepID=UPI0025C2BD51|nr:hypothetical protein [Hyphomicrobium sp.]MBZ0210290.1 hypothetical protein [Hyphomicrobium sp.]
MGNVDRELPAKLLWQWRFTDVTWRRLPDTMLRLLAKISEAEKRQVKSTRVPPDA